MISAKIVVVSTFAGADGVAVDGAVVGVVVHCIVIAPVLPMTDFGTFGITAFDVTFSL